MQWLAQAARLDPARADVQKLLALATTDLGALADAAAAWDRYIGLRPDDDAARRQRLPRPAGLRDLDGPWVDDRRVALHHVDTKPAVAFHRVVRLDLANNSRHPLHQLGEIEARVGVGDAVARRVLHLLQQVRRADQRLARHAAGVQAIAAHAPRLDQRDLRLHRGGDVARDQARRAGTDDNHVAIEALRLRVSPLRINLAPLDAVDDSLRYQRKNTEQHERCDERRRQDALQRVDSCELRPGVDVDQRAGQHAHLAHEVEHPGVHARQPHHEVDDEEREQRHQAQGEEVERAFAGDALVDLGQPRAEVRLHAVAQHVARREERERRANAGCERDDQRAREQAEDCAGSQRHDRRAGQRQRRHRDIDREERPDHLHGLVGIQRSEIGLTLLDVVEMEIAAEIESEIRRDERDERDQQEQFLARHHHAENARQPAHKRVAIVRPHSAAKTVANSANCAGHRHISAKHASVSVPSVRPPR